MLLSIGIIPIYADIDYSKCGGFKCFEFLPTENMGKQTHPNWSMIIHLPTYGNTDDKWVTILSDNNMTTLKNNVAYMAVLDIHTTTEKPNTNYCPLAQFIWDNQDGYQKNLENLTKYVIPSYCDKELHPQPVPEMNPFLVISIGVLITLSLSIVARRFKT